MTFLVTFLGRRRRAASKLRGLRGVVGPWSEAYSWASFEAAHPGGTTHHSDPGDSRRSSDRRRRRGEPADLPAGRGRLVAALPGVGLAQRPAVEHRHRTRHQGLPDLGRLPHHAADHRPPARPQRAHRRRADARGILLQTLDHPVPPMGARCLRGRARARHGTARHVFEGGGHRVQRVPVTESQGRIHTSTVTVVALPEVEESEIVIDEKDLRIDIFHAGGHGGQSVNTTNSAIRITHLPTGIMVAMQDERSLRQNKERAMMVLRTRLNDIQRAEAAKNASAARKNLIGTGDRSEKIRTYNFPQDRVTDHRIHYSRSNVNAVMDGDIDDIISELKKCELDVIRTENGISE